MCVVCYLSTDRVIDEIPFDENKPGFNISLEDRYFDCLTKRFVYYCGASEGCGCGFGDLDITEEILQQTEQELQNGTLTENTESLWWNHGLRQPNKENFDEIVAQIRESHRDTLALYDVIKETHQEGFESELLFFWAGDENLPITEIIQIRLAREPIDVDFNRVLYHMGTVLLYHFM